MTSTMAFPNGWAVARRPLTEEPQPPAGAVGPSGSEQSVTGPCDPAGCYYAEGPATRPNALGAGYPDVRYMTRRAFSNRSAAVAYAEQQPPVASGGLHPDALTVTVDPEAPSGLIVHRNGALLEQRWQLTVAQQLADTLGAIMRGRDILGLPGRVTVHVRESAGANMATIAVWIADALAHDHGITPAVPPPRPTA